VFGLPGNPVSSLVCFELFVRAALDLLGGNPRQPALTGAQLAAPFVHRGDRPTWHPARWRASDAPPPVVELLPWQGSGDLRTLTEANCLVAFEPGNRQYESGQIVAIWKLAGGDIP
jgi:molybdopterin molybdotransferase